LNNIIVIGAGLNGSILADTLVAHMISVGFSYDMVVIDHDTVEMRNSPGNLDAKANAGKKKAEVVSDMFLKNGIVSRAVTQKITEKNVGALIPPGTALVFGAVDNIKARKIVYEYAVNNGVPYIDLGISDTSASITWATGGITNFPFSGDGAIVYFEQEDVKKPPCELIASRIMASMAAECAATSACIFLRGHDPRGTVFNTIGVQAMKGDVVSWEIVHAGKVVKADSIYLGRVEYDDEG